MESQTHDILLALQRAAFPHAVAIRSGAAHELGPVLEADALDVPAGRVLEQEDALARILWQHAFGASTVLPGALDPEESRRLRAALPTGTTWYLPTAPRRSMS